MNAVPTAVLPPHLPRELESGKGYKDFRARNLGLGVQTLLL